MTLINSPIMKKANPETEIISSGIKKSKSLNNPQDRSYEFQSVVSSLTGFGINLNIKQVTARKNNSLTATTKKVKEDIYSTFDKLMKLKLIMESANTRLDDTTKLIEMIKTDVSTSSNQLIKLQQSLKFHKMNHQYLAHSNAAIMAMQYMLGNISSELKTILETKHQAMIKLKNSQTYNEDKNQEQYTSHQSFNNIQNPQNNRPNDAFNKPPVYIPFDQHSHSQSSSQPSYAQSVIPQQDQLLRHRAAPQRVNEIRGIEQTIVELGDMFQQLAEIVQDQEYVVNRIDSHLDMTHLNVESAHNELAKYFRYISSNRSFYMKIFIVLILTFVGIIFILK